jgi:hypothetical protein
VSKSSAEYEDDLHIVNSSDALRELVHGYLERGLTLNEHWEVALAVDLSVVKESQVNALKRKHVDAMADVSARDAQIHGLNTNLAKAKASTTQCLKEGKKRESSMQAKIDELQAEVNKSGSSGEEQLFQKIKDSAKEAVADVMRIEDRNKRKKAMNMLQRQCHPDTNPSALSWLFTELFKFLDS